MNKRRVLFWLFIGLLLLIDGALLIYQFKKEKPKADIQPTPASSLSRTNLFPTPLSAINENAPEIKFSQEQTIYSLDSNYHYDHPVLIQRTNDYLLFLARGKSSLRLNEIIYLRSLDLKNWSKAEIIWSDKYKHIADIEGQKTKKGFYLFFITEQNQKTSAQYLYSAKGSNWELFNLPKSDTDLSRLSLFEDKNTLRLLSLSKDQKIIQQTFSLDGKKWSNFKETVKLNLKVDDIGCLKIDSYYILFMTINNELYYTPSLDFYSFSKPTSILNLATNNFFLNSISLVYKNEKEILIRSLL